MKALMLKCSPFRLQVMIGLLAQWSVQIYALGWLLGKGYKICDCVVGPPKALPNTAYVPRRDQMGVICSQVMQGSSHSRDTFFPISTCLCTQTVAYAELGSQGFFWMPWKLSFPEQIYELTWKPAVQTTNSSPILSSAVQYLSLLILYLHKTYHIFILRTKSICTADMVLLYYCGKIPLLEEV